jgi:hypothetical protein
VRLGRLDNGERPADVGELSVVRRRFRCDAVLCGRQIFAERFADDALAPWARRTARLDHLVHLVREQGQLAVIRRGKLALTHFRRGLLTTLR